MSPLVLSRSGRVARSIRITFVALGVFLSASVRSQSVTLAWSPSTNADVAGYHLYYGGATQTYTNMVAVAAITNTTVSGLVAGAQYFFAATTVDSAGLESVFSNETSYQVPIAPAGPTPPPITWPTPANIVYGTVLAAGQLNATSSIPGIFTYNPSAGTVLSAGAQVLSVTFNPADTNSYLSAATNVTLVVLPQALTITAANASKLYGAAMPALTATYSGFVNGDTAGSLATPPALTTTATAASPVGSYPITAGGAASPNYAINLVGGTLTISPAATAVLLTSSANPSLPGTAVTFTTALSAVAPGAGTPTGTVQFIVDNAAAGSPIPVSGGTAAYNTSALGHGRHTVAAQYGGDGNFNGSTNLFSGTQVVDTPPVPGPTALTYDSATGIKLSLATLLSTASDADGDPVTLASLAATSANAGSVSSSGGWIFYLPPPGFTNADTFSYSISDGYCGPVTGAVTLSLRAQCGSAANLTVSALGNGSYAIGGSGVPGRLYQIQLTDGGQTGPWQPLGQALADSNGVFGLTDPAGSPQRLYRTVCP